MSKFIKLNILIVTIMVLSFFFITPTIYASEIDIDNNYDDEEIETRDVPPIVSGYYHSQCDYGNGYQINTSIYQYEEFYIESMDYYEFMEAMEDYGCYSITFNISFTIYKGLYDANKAWLYIQNWDNSPNNYDELQYDLNTGLYTYNFTFNLSNENLNNRLCIRYKSAISNCYYYLQSTTVYINYNSWDVTTGLTYNGYN